MKSNAALIRLHQNYSNNIPIDSLKVFFKLEAELNKFKKLRRKKLTIEFRKYYD